MSCPICKSDTHVDYRPFCSKRCADIDLGKWIKGDYAIALDDPEDVEEAFEQLHQQPAKPH